MTIEPWIWTWLWYLGTIIDETEPVGRWLLGLLGI